MNEARLVITLNAGPRELPLSCPSTLAGRNPLVGDRRFRRWSAPELRAAALVHFWEPDGIGLTFQDRGYLILPGRQDLAGEHFEILKLADPAPEADPATYLYLLRDLDTEQGTLLNGRELTEGRGCQLRDADEIDLGYQVRIMNPAVRQTELPRPESKPSAIPEQEAELGPAAADWVPPIPPGAMALVEMLRLHGTRARRLLGPDRPPLTIGRDPNCLLAIDPSLNTVSRFHASIRWHDGQLLLEDQGSSNGTTVDGIRVRPGEPVPLPHGCLVSCGGVMQLRCWLK